MTQTPDLHLPEHVSRLREGENFTFACHPGVPCFTECCHQLDLALSPYDVLRLARELKISGKDFLHRYAVIEHQEGDIFPHVYLGMIDDGKASCPFVSERGCLIYPGRPAACRTYPLGRGAWQDGNGRDHAFFVLIKEPHCQGFVAPSEITLELWINDQGLADYYSANDLLISLLQHEKIKQGFRPSAEQRDLFLAVLYNLEEFGKTSGTDSTAMTDLELLKSAVAWLTEKYFNKQTTSV
ncbi:MAG: YkgJ family cysteine cluster protein [Pseudomonadota bacterium]